MPVQIFISWGKRVAYRFRRDFTGSRGWKCILAQHRGCNPRRTSKLVDTVCCVLSTTTVIVELCLVCCGQSLRIASW